MRPSRIALAGRLAKLAMVASLGGFALLVTGNNLVDYGSNALFVRHVLSMDTTFPANALLGRALPHPWQWRAAYGAIIAGEACTGAAFLVAAVAMLRALAAPAASFERAKLFVHVGGAIGFLVWFTGFMVVGGEWFAMWQSHLWNGQEAAFRFFLTLLAVLIYVNQAEPAGG